MKTTIKKAWKAKARRTNPNVYFSDKAILNHQFNELACKAIGKIAMGLMSNCQIIHSDDGDLHAHYDKNENHIYIFQQGEDIKFNK